MSVAITEPTTEEVTPVTEEIVTPEVVADTTFPEAEIIAEKTYQVKIDSGEWMETFQQMVDFDGIRICFKGKSVDELNLMLKDLSNITITIREMPTDVIIRTEMNLYPENIILDIATNSAMVKFKRLSQEAISALTVKNMAETAQSNIEYLAMMLEVEL